MRKIAEPSLARLRDATGETVHLAIRSGDELVYIDKIESQEVVRMASTIGTRISFHASSVGKAFLSALPTSDAENMIDHMTLTRFTSFTAIDCVTLQETVKQARAAGFVCDNQENEIGIVCFGAAICDGADHPVASVSISVPLFRLSNDASRYSAPLLQATAEISAQLGFIRSP